MARKLWRVYVENSGEVGRKIRRAGDDVIGVLPIACETGGKLVASLAAKRAPGPFIKVAKGTPWTVKAATFEVGPDKAHWYYRFFEFGVSPFEINMIKKKTVRGTDNTRRGAKRLAALGLSGGRPINTDKRAVVVKGKVFSRVFPGGFRAEPFLRNTLVEGRELIARVIGATFVAALDALLESK